MKSRFGALAAFLGVGTLCLAVPAFGQTPVTVNLNNVNGDPTVNVGGISVYAGVYGGTTTLPGANPGIVCDDFNDEVGVPSSWSATAYQVSTLGTTTPITDVLFGGAPANVAAGYTNIGKAGYAELAYLVNLMFNTTNTTTQADISEAIWKITDPALSGVDSAALTLDGQAASYASSTGDSLSQYSNLWVYTPNPTGSGQEMWGTVPEGGATALYLLLAGAACFGAMRFSSRNQFGSRETA
jgi:hypothetical protein